MEDTKGIQLTTLWFAALIFLQTDPSGTGGALITAVSIVAIVLSYVLPVTILGLLGFHLLTE